MTIENNSRIRDYRIISKIGEGGMGEVYLAEDENLYRKVAIKILTPGLTRDPKLVERFKQESRIQASLIHSNIVTLYTFFTEKNNYFMVMEFAEGITLKELIARTGPIPENRAIKILLQILGALEFAHKKGIVHRDIKPANIMLDGDDNIKVMDFGIAKILGEKGLTSTGTKMGTIYYMSPEQVRAEKNINHQTDIYSAGIIFYQMLSGKLPFNTSTESDFEIMKEIVEGQIADPRETYPHIHDDTVKILFEMVSKNRNERSPGCSKCISKLNAAYEYLISLEKTDIKFELPEENSDMLPSSVVINPEQLVNDESSNSEEEGSMMPFYILMLVLIMLLIISSIFK